MSKIRLGVNIDHVATVRNARGENYPSPLRAALLCQEYGADGITTHLREDRRHIRDDDINEIIENISIPLNFEMAPTDEMVNIAVNTGPNACCIVPEKREEITTEGGIDVKSNHNILVPKIEKIKKNNKVTQDQVKNIENSKLTFSEEDALRNQLFGCWNFPLGIPFDDNLIVKIKLKLKPDGTVTDTEVLDHARMNKPGQNFYKILAESALRAIRMCTPLKVPSSGYERWKEIQMNFDAREMLRG